MPQKQHRSARTVYNLTKAQWEMLHPDEPSNIYILSKWKVLLRTPL